MITALKLIALIFLILIRRIEIKFKDGINCLWAAPILLVMACIWAGIIYLSYDLIVNNILTLINK